MARVTYDGGAKETMIMSEHEEIEPGGQENVEKEGELTDADLGKVSGGAGRTSGSTLPSTTLAILADDGPTETRRP